MQAMHFFFFFEVGVGFFGIKCFLEGLHLKILLSWKCRTLEGLSPYTHFVVLISCKNILIVVFTEHIKVKCHFCIASVTNTFKLQKKRLFLLSSKTLFKKKSSDNWYFQLNVSLSLPHWYILRKIASSMCRSIIWCMIKNYSFELFFIHCVNNVVLLWLSIRHPFYDSWIDVNYPEHTSCAVFSHVWCTISTREPCIFFALFHRVFMLPQIHFIHMRLNMNSYSLPVLVNLINNTKIKPLKTRHLKNF